jgi:hypothetical protein
MTTEDDDAGIDENEKLSFNGIDAATGGYLFEPMSSAEIAGAITGPKREAAEGEKEHLADLKRRAEGKGEAHFGVKEGIDPTKLEEAGWGVIFPAVAAGSDEAKEQEAILAALAPLLSLRRSQAARVKEHYYKEYRGALGYRPGESKQRYLSRLGVGPGPADPEKVPYYLLIVGSPQIIPYHVQYQIDVQYAVGRLHFDTVEEYASYARSVVAAETSGLSLPREIAFLGVANPDDPATQLSRKNLVGPLADMAEGWSDLTDFRKLLPEGKRWKISRYYDDDARKAKVLELFGGPKTPAIVFSGSHGMGFRRGNPLQHRHQGALLLQDWTGPTSWHGPIPDDLYLSGDDLPSDAGPLGLISFNFACYGGGTPEYDEFSRQAFKERKAIADRAFVSGLHRKLLGHPKGGALAAIGHVERAWGYSFMWGTGKKSEQTAQLAVFESTLQSLMKGMPVGLAVEYFNQRYAEMASDLARQIEELEYDASAADAYTVANTWTSSNDARGYAVIGDPAVRLPFGDAAHPEKARARGAIDVSLFSSAAAAPAATAASEIVAAAAPTAEEVHFGLLGGGNDKPKAEGGAAPPGMFQGFVGQVIGTLGKAVEDAMTLEVRTYVSSKPLTAAAVDRAALARDGDLRAFTRIEIDGDVDAVVPERDGAIDTALWSLHVELVKQAQAARAETIKMVLSSISGLIKL